jgi:hypothetical protein
MVEPVIAAERTEPRAEMGLIPVAVLELVQQARRGCGETRRVVELWPGVPQLRLEPLAEGGRGDVVVEVAGDLDADF